MQATGWLVVVLAGAMAVLGAVGHHWVTARFAAGTEAARAARLLAGWVPAAVGSAELTRRVPSLLGAPGAVVLTADAAGGLFLVVVLVLTVRALRRLCRPGTAT
ncbi:hypothetical protein [Kitasatospora sp. NBC_01539]|uniref:hypothetical protein n=1 Tax=Kitasatospora sp. NBC_01539 TaxID=2903577 RepID=UPI003860132D